MSYATKPKQLNTINTIIKKLAIMRFLLNKYAIGIIIVMGLLQCFLFTLIIKEYDASYQATIVCDKKLPGNVWLVSYADGDDVHFQNQRYLMASALNKCVDFYKPYNAGHMDPAYKKAHASILSQAKGAGYWLWKPYLILKTLQEIPENDIVFYVDSGSSLRRPIDALVNHLADHDIVAFKSLHLNKKYIKRDFLRIMDADNDEVLDQMGVQASFLLIKNTPFSRNFVKKWLALCEDEKMLTDLPSKNEHSEFISHTHDQSILSLMVLDNPEKFYIMPFESGREDYFFHHRRRQNNAMHPLGIWEHILMN